MFLMKVSSAEPVSSGTSPASDQILRFREAERMVHWAIAVPFMICWTTAVVLVAFYNPEPLRPFRAVFSWIHRLSGVALIVLPIVAAIRHRSDFHLHVDNIKEGWVWTPEDLKWLWQMGPAAIRGNIVLPEQGKFNAAEKLNFMAVMSSVPLLAVTGVLIWLPGIAFESWMVHLAIAIAVTPLMLGHIFMATINPSTRVGLQGMISGYVERQWAKHHYQRWYREHFASEDRGRPRTPRKPSLVNLPVRIRFSCCRAEHMIPSWARLRESIVGAGPLICPSCETEIGQLSLIPPASLVDPCPSFYLLARPRSGDTLDSDLPPSAWTRALPPPQSGRPPTRFGGTELSRNE
jgi:formate dehydrogenase subunit gamma